MICAKCNATVTSWRVVDGATWCMACSKDVPTYEQQIAALKAENERLQSAAQTAFDGQMVAFAEKAGLKAIVEGRNAQFERMEAEIARLTAEKAADFATLSAANKAAKAENDALAKRLEGAELHLHFWGNGERDRLLEQLRERDAEIARLKADVAALRDAMARVSLRTLDDGPCWCAVKIAHGEAHHLSCQNARAKYARTEPK